jgi:predicted HTH domain antitoxin
MPGASAKTFAVSVDLPVDAVPTLDSAQVAGRLTLLWILDQVRQGRLSSGRGAELAQVPRYDFMVLMGKHGIPILGYDEEDFNDEIRTLRRLAGQ